MTRRGPRPRTRGRRHSVRARGTCWQHLPHLPELPTLDELVEDQAAAEHPPAEAATSPRDPDNLARVHTRTHARARRESS